MGTPTTFSFPSMRRLYRYLGETDALVELTELSTRSFIASAKQSGDVGTFVVNQSQQHGIRVNLAEVDSLSRHLGRSYIVTVYQSAERFLHEFRREHRALYANEWTGDGDDVDPLTVALRNVAPSEDEAVKRVGADLISLFQYYRILRNWVVHTKESDVSKPSVKFHEIVPYSAENQHIFRALNAPNPPADICFDDFIFFSRLTKFIAEKLCTVAEPPIDHWVRTFQLAPFKRLENNPLRMRNAVSGRLRTDYGMDAPTAQWIAEELCGSLAER